MSKHETKVLLWIWLVHNICWKLECWLYIFATTRANRVDTSPSYLLFQTLLPLFWTLTCMIWMELTRTDSIFSRIAMVLFLCRNKSSRNDLKINGEYFGIYKKYWQKNQGQGPTPCPRGWGRALPPGRTPLSRGPPDAPPTSTPTPYISFHGEKNHRESFIAFYDMEPPPSPNLSREGWSGVQSGLRRGEFVAVIIINHPPSPISWCSPPCVSNSIIGLLDGDGLDEIYHVIKLVLLGFDT